jgi:hypothetical protein
MTGPMIINSSWFFSRMDPGSGNHIPIVTGIRELPHLMLATDTAWAE